MKKQLIKAIIKMQMKLSIVVKGTRNHDIQIIARDTRSCIEYRLKLCIQR